MDLSVVFCSGSLRGGLAWSLAAGHCFVVGDDGGGALWLASAAVCRRRGTDIRAAFCCLVNEEYGRSAGTPEGRSCYFECARLRYGR